MPVASLQDASQDERYARLMRAYLTVLGASEAAPALLRPLVVYYTQSHVGQRATQMGDALVRSRACEGHTDGIAKLDERREDLTLLESTLERRVTVGRLTAVISVGGSVSTLAANKVGWFHDHGQVLSLLIYAAAVLAIAADAYGTVCFGCKLGIFERAGVYADENDMHDHGFLPSGAEPSLALHLRLWALLVGAATGVAVWRATGSTWWGGAAAIVTAVVVLCAQRAGLGRYRRNCQTTSATA